MLVFAVLDWFSCGPLITDQVGTAALTLSLRQSDSPPARNVLGLTGSSRIGAMKLVFGLEFEKAQSASVMPWQM